jgi:uncharacterized protein (DUF4415 family)
MPASKKTTAVISRKPKPEIGWYDANGEWVDPDDAPDLTQEPWRSKFLAAPLRVNGKIVKRGRPMADQPKQSTTIRLDADILTHFRMQGPGWQTRLNAALREWLDQQTPASD